MIALLMFTAAAWADPALDALQEELDRAAGGLTLEGAEAPYYVSYRYYDVHRIGVTAQLGGFVAFGEAPDRDLGVEVRVGSEAYDNSNFQSNRWDDDNGFDSVSLVIEDVPLALRHDAWLKTDSCYKDAVETLAAKQAADRRRAGEDDLPDFAPGPPQSAAAPAAPAPDAEALKALAGRLSARFLEHPEVEFSIVYASSETGRRATLDSRGARVVEPVSELTLRVVARARAADGATAVDHASWVVRTPDDLPEEAALAAEVDALAERLTAWRALPTFDDEVVGPVLFEGDAALELFRRLLLPALEGTPPPEQPSSGTRMISFGDEPDGPAALQVKRRVLPPGFDVTDDPRADAGSPAAYAYDMEGEPAQAITLVKDGIVRTHYASRTPGQGAQASNGHARGRVGTLMPGVAAITRVEAGRPERARRVHKEALKLAASYGQDHYLVVRRLSDPALAGADVGAMLRLGGDSEALPAPIAVYRVYRDGREEALRGAAFSGVDVRLLRDIAAVGQTQTGTFLQPLNGRLGGPTSGAPTTLTAPEVLISEVVLMPSKADIEAPPKLESPLAER
jgi:TldD protein